MAGKVCPVCGCLFPLWTVVFKRFVSDRIHCCHCGAVLRYDVTIFPFILYWLVMLTILSGLAVILEGYVWPGTTSDNTLLESLFPVLIIISGIAAKIRTTLHCWKHCRFTAVPNDKRLPSHRGKWIIGTAFLMFLISLVVLEFCLNGVHSNTQLQSRSVSLISDIRFISLCIGLSASEIIGIRTLRKACFRQWRAFIMPVMATIFFLVLIGFSGWFSGTMSQISNLFFMKEDPQCIENQINNPDTDLKQRSFLSHSYAAETYIRTDESIDYLTEDGTWERFIPAESDLEIKRQLRVIEGMAASSIQAAYLLLIVFVVSLGVAFFTPVRKN